MAGLDAEYKMQEKTKEQNKKLEGKVLVDDAEDTSHAMFDKVVKKMKREDAFEVALSIIKDSNPAEQRKMLVKRIGNQSYYLLGLSDKGKQNGNERDKSEQDATIKQTLLECLTDDLLEIQSMQQSVSGSIDDEAIGRSLLSRYSIGKTSLWHHIIRPAFILFCIVTTVLYVGIVWHPLKAETSDRNPTPLVSVPDFLDSIDVDSGLGEKIDL